MAQCVAINATTGAVEASTADPCTTLVLLTPAEYASWTASAFSLSAEDGAALGGAIVAAWCVAWGIRALYMVIQGDGTGATE